MLHPAALGPPTGVARATPYDDTPWRAVAGEFKAVEALIEKMTKAKMTIRIEDAEMGQMPIHKIARVGDKADALVRVRRECRG